MRSIVKRFIMTLSTIVNNQDQFTGLFRQEIRQLSQGQRDMMHNELQGMMLDLEELDKEIQSKVS